MAQERKPDCSTCILRPFWDGGNGRCPFPKQVYDDRKAIGPGNGCKSWVLGTRYQRPAPAEPPEEGLF